MKVIYSIVILFYHLTSFGQNEEVTGKYEYMKNHHESGIYVEFNF